MYFHYVHLREPMNDDVNRSTMPWTDPPRREPIGDAVHLSTKKFYSARRGFIKPRIS